MDEPLVSGVLEQNAGGWVLHKKGDFVYSFGGWKLEVGQLCQGGLW